MDEGHLPNLKRLTQEGAWGQLKSTLPPTTAPAWAACYTGVNPGKHGIFDFRESPFVDPSRPLISSRSVRAPKLWHLLNRHKQKTGLLNIPITYPPEQVDGFVVSGMMTPGPDAPYTYPVQLKEEILDLLPDYVVNIDIPQYDVEEEEDAHAFLDDIAHSFQRRAELLYYFVENKEWQFLMAVFIVLDRIQHLLWKYYQDPESRFYHMQRAPRLRARILEIHQQVDHMVGQLLERLDENTDLIIVSDHGFGSTKAWFNVNTWLQKEGLLTIKPQTNLRKRLFYQAMRLNDSRLVRRLVPAGLHRTIRWRVRGTRSTFRSDLVESIDWDKTQAFFASIPCQGIYINLRREGRGTVAPGGEYDTLRERLRRQLLGLRDPRTKEKLVDHVWYREEVYHGPYAEWAPDVLFVARDYAYLGRELLGASRIIETSMNWANGFHRMNGIFLARGRGFRQGREIQGAQIMDIAPTILYRMGLPVPTHMDGQVLKSALEPSFLETHALQQETLPVEVLRGPAETYSDEESAEIEARLKGLGYMA
jgi:predicted AlkP superfamily phosphohydrolase/phosphomutase